MFSSTADPIALLLKSLQPQNKAPLFPFNISAGQSVIGTIIVAAGLHEDNINVLKQLYFGSAWRARKTKLILNFVFEDQGVLLTNQPDIHTDPSMREFLSILEGVLQSPRCFCPTVQVDGVEKENVDASIRIAASCHCKLLRFTQCFTTDILLETVHLHHLLSHSQALCLKLSAPVAMVDYKGLGEAFYDSWSVFARPNDELQLIAFRAQIRDETDFVSAAVDVGLSGTEERAVKLFQTLEQF